MKKNKRIWSWALAGALAVSNLSMVAAPFTSIVAQAEAVWTAVGVAGTSVEKCSITAQVDANAGDIKDDSSTPKVVYGKGTVKLTAALESGHAVANGNLDIYRVDSSSMTKITTSSKAITTGTAESSFIDVEIPNIQGTQKYVAKVGDTEIASTTITINPRTELSSKSSFTGKYTITDNVVSAGDTIYAHANNPTRQTVTCTFKGITEDYYYNKSAAKVYLAYSGDNLAKSGFNFTGADEDHQVAFTGNTTAALTATITSAKPCSYDVKVMFDPDGTGPKSPFEIGSAGYESVKATFVSEEIERTDEGLLVNASGKTDTGLKDTMKLKATITANDNVAFESATVANWAIYAADDLGGTDLADGTKFAAISANGNLDTGVLTSAADVTAKAAPAGDYIAVAYVVNATPARISPYAQYPFTITSIPSSITIGTDSGKDLSSDDYYVGETDKLILNIDNVHKREYESAEFELADDDDEQYVSLSSDGTFTVLKHKVGGIAVNLKSYTMTNQLELPTLPGSTYATITDTISTAQDVLLVSGLTTNRMSVGTDKKLVAKYGKNDVSNEVVWSSDNDKFIAVDSDGTIHAKAAGSATITAKYFVNKKLVDQDSVGPITVDAVKYDAFLSGKTTAIGNSGVSLRPGKSADVVLKADNNKEISGTIKWESDKTTVATVEGIGAVVKVSILSNAKANQTANITASVNGTKAVTFTVKVTDALYTAKDANGKLIEDSTGNTSSKYHATLYKGESIALTALYDDEEVEGTWKLTAGKDTTVELSGNIVTATSEDPFDNEVTFTPKDKKTAAITIKLTTTGDAYELYKDGKLEPSRTITVPSMTVGDILTYSVKLGAKVVTNDLTWTTRNDSVIAVNDGVITALKEYSAAVIVEAKDSLGAVQVTITIDEVIPKNAEEMDAEAATKAANEAAEKANAAAKAAEANPTAETVAAAKAAAEAATKAAEAATKAAEATSNETAKKAAKAAAEAASAAAKTATDAATAAQAKIDEAAKKAEEEKKAAEEAAKKSDGSAAGTPAPAGNELKDTTGATTGYVVTNATPGKATVEYKGNDADKKLKSVKIPDTVKDASGNEYKVTSIAANAFAGSATTTVTIGKNIKKIDPKAFAGSKVKKVNVKGTKLTKSSAKFVNKMKKGSTVKVTGKNKKANKKLLNKQSAVKKGKVKVK